MSVEKNHANARVDGLMTFEMNAHRKRRECVVLMIVGMSVEFYYCYA